MVQGVLGPGQHLGGPQPMARAGLRGGQHRGQDQQSPEHTQAGQAYPSQALVPTEPPLGLTPYSVSLEELGVGAGLT